MFRVEAKDSKTRARAGRLTLPHGEVETPIFMPVGTQAALKAVTPAQAEEAGAQIVLANTYHLSIRPGEGLIQKAGGLHPFTGWHKPILTDSGGFQIFSLEKRQLSDEGVSFRYQISGEAVTLTPERSMQIQNALGADIIMAFDECVPYPATYEQAQEAVRRTTLWAKRCLVAHKQRDRQHLFGIVQGSVFPDLRERSAKEITAMDFPGFAIGGLSVGEGPVRMNATLDATVPFMPENKPRYLMGVGFPEDILEAVARGVDMFDCVIPTRLARGASAFTHKGRIRLTDRRYRTDLYPIDTSCECYTCRNFSRAYLRHLFFVREVLSSTLVSIHNIHFYLKMMAEIRTAIREDRYDEYYRAVLAKRGPESGRERAARGETGERKQRSKREQQSTRRAPAAADDDYDFSEFDEDDE
jgi:queuine tRNA-ribosyltransferase